GLPVEGAAGLAPRRRIARLRLWRRAVHGLRRLRLSSRRYPRVSPAGLSTVSERITEGSTERAQRAAPALRQGRPGHLLEPPGDGDGALAHLPPGEIADPPFAGLPSQAAGFVWPRVPGGYREPGRVSRRRAVRRARPGAGGRAHPRGIARRAAAARMRPPAGRRAAALAAH